MSHLHLSSLVLSPITCYLLHKQPLRGDTATLLILSLYLGSPLTLTLLSETLSLPAAFRACATNISLHLLSVALLTVLYRISPFHPLYSIPGPFLNKVTAITGAYISYTGKQHIIVSHLHEKYGVFVRLGPNSVSINSHSAVLPIYAQAKCYDKSDAYVLGREKNTGLFFITKRSEHKTRKNVWAAAFTPAWLDGYSPRLERRARQLVNCIADESNAFPIVRLDTCTQHWGYDVMGDVVFGGVNRIETMSNGDPHGYVRCGQQATAMFDILGKIPWLLDILWYLQPSSDIHALEALAHRMMTKRQTECPEEPNDLCAHLLGEVGDMKYPLTEGELMVDACFAIQAGSDSTATVLSFILFFLISDPAKLEQLRNAIEDPSLPSEMWLDSRRLADLPYLNAVVFEGLRLGTPFPGLPRIAPEPGVHIEGQFFPPGTTLSVPAYAQQISAQNFSPEPLKFIPERWIDEENYTTRKQALMCFSYGQFSCLGKPLALQELRMATAYIVTGLDLKFPPDFDSGKFLDCVDAIKTTIFRYPLSVMARRRRAV